MSTQTSTVTEVIEETEIIEPGKYRVILHNDDKTTFDFVIFILRTVFDKDLEEAAEITLRIHDIGAATAGIYSHQIAESKVDETSTLSKANQFPLKATAEEF